MLQLTTMLLKLFAVENDAIGAIKLLIATGANTTIKNNRGCTARESIKNPNSTTLKIFDQAVTQRDEKLAATKNNINIKNKFDEEAKKESVERIILLKKLNKRDTQINKKLAVTTKIQALTRGFLTRKNLRSDSSARESIKKPDSTTILIFNEAEAQRNEKLAATKIQALSRGFLTRKSLKTTRSDSSIDQSELESLKTVTQRNAAIEIQALTRGFLVRKNLKAKESDLSIDQEEIIHQLDYNDSETTCYCS
ncbi:MAG: hypothetical protein JO129_00570 [Candidatus Dependentiae bacterium]|nr:hypothetical protein [Candidatus Dependentiae bacterium]